MLGDAPSTGNRRDEVLDAAAELIVTGGIRASLRDIADACGILPGSLYHHFDSKEAILVELVERYLADLDAVAAAAEEADGADAPLAAVEQLGTAIADTAVRHRAALLLTFNEPPRSYGTELARLASRTPEAITAAMADLLARAEAAGALRPGLDLPVLADQLCQSMLHVGIGVYHRTRAARDVPALKCRLLLHGLATKAPADRTLDRSPARRAADAQIAAWEPREDGDDRRAQILAAARAEFGRRGYEATTVRDVAATAGVSARAVYRVVASKEDLLLAILGGYVDKVTEGWDAVLGADAPALERLDALVWLDINLLHRFQEEHRIQSASLQFAPPTSPDLGLSFPKQLRQVRDLLADGDREGVLRDVGTSADVRARTAFSLIWTPENIIERLGPAETLRFTRETLLRGAAAP